MKQDKILLDHGAGGKASHRLTAELLLPVFDSPLLARLHDGAVFEVGGRRLAFTTDSYTVDPIFFPGGDIGELAVNGTVNDLAMCGARPLYLSAALIIEEGFPMADLRRIVASMGRAAGAAGVEVVTGDTKVVPRGAADGIFINTSGVGEVPAGVEIAADRARVGDRIILSGTIGDHGVTVLSRRKGLALESEVESDTAPLNHLVAAVLAACPQVRVLRDPTRGGVGTALNEVAAAAGVAIRIFEERLPVSDPVRGICELLGFDPLYLANEGKLLAFVPPEAAGAVLAVMRADERGRSAVEIGEVVAGAAGRVTLKTRIGGERIVDMLAGEQLPRIC